MCDPVTATLAIGMVMQGVASYEQGQYQKGVARYNARNAENEATRTRNKGTQEEMKQRRQTAELISKQRAQLGANNIALDSGSALQLQTDAALLGEVDALRIRQNHADAGRSLDNRALLTSSAGDMAAQAGRNALTASVVQAGGTALAGVPSGEDTAVSSQWYNTTSSGASANAAFGNIA